MSEYQLKSNERFNGGYTLEIGDCTLRILGGYAPSWEKVYDTENSFTNHDGSEYKVLKGIRFSLKIDIGHIPTEYFSSLAEELKKPSVMLKCPDFEGECRCDNIPAQLKQANFLGVRYGISFTLTAENLISDQGGGREFYGLTIDGFDFPRFEGVKIMENADGYGISGVCMTEMTFSVPFDDYDRYTITSSAKVDFKLSGIFSICPSCYISTRSRKGNKVSFKCYDRLIYTNQPISVSESQFDSMAENDTGLVNAQLIVQYIASQCGLGDSVSYTANVPDLLLPKEDIVGSNCRDILERISEAWCGYFKVSLFGNLCFVAFGTVVKHDAGSTAEKHEEIAEGSIKGPIHQIIVTNGSETYIEGEHSSTDFLNTLKISTQYASHELAAQLMTRLRNYVYTAWDCGKCVMSNILAATEINAEITFADGSVRTANYLTKIPTPQGIFITCGSNEVTESEFDYTGALSRQIKNRIADGEKLGNNTMVTKYQGIIHLAPKETKAKSLGQAVAVKKFGYSPATSDGVVEFDGAMVSRVVPKSASINKDKTEVIIDYGEKKYKYNIQRDANGNITSFSKEEIKEETQ